MPANWALKAIDTPYRGRLFRSRLEARWAVFYDALAVRWEYEREGYKLPGRIRYLPDFKFWTPQGNYRWLEIKSWNVTSDPKFDAFCKALEYSNESATLVSGTPLEWLENGNSFCPRCGVPHKSSWGADIYCFSCDMETPCGGGHKSEANGVLNTTWRPHKGSICVKLPELQRFRRGVEAAAVKAQSARFEYGERG